MPRWGTPRPAPRQAIALAGIVGLGLAGLLRGPVSATAGGPVAVPVVHPRRVRHFNVGRAHSPQLLRQLAGPGGRTAAPLNSPAAHGTPLANAVQGVDVASYQEEPGIDWQQVASGGKRFAAVKATEGAYYANPYARSDLTAAKAAGLAVFAYAFAIPNGDGASSSPVTQADYAIAHAADLNGSLPPLMLDIEYDPYAGQDGTNECYGLSAAGMVAWVSSFAAEVTARTGQPPVIYTTRGWWQACTGGSTAFGRNQLWVAAATGTGDPGPLPAGWASWIYWQYGQGTASGIAGTVDLDQLNPGLLTLFNPGSQHITAGSPVRPVQIQASRPGLSYRASGMPPGLSISAGGLITGWPDQPGRYHVAVTAAGSGGASAPVLFSWAVAAASDRGPAGQLRLDLRGRCLNDVANRSASGTPLDTWTCNSSSAQHWTYVQDETVRIHGKCLTAPSHAGWKVRLEPCTGAASRQWQLVYPRAVSTTAGRIPLTLVNPASGWCLQDPRWGRANGTRVLAARCNGYKNQSWTLPAGPVTSQVPGTCLDDKANATSDGTQIDLRPCNGTAAQQWLVEPDGTIRDHGKCLDVRGAGVAAGTGVDLWSCHRTVAQQWRLVPDGSGTDLVNPHAGLCLTDPGDAVAGGTALVIDACTAAAGQRWRVS
jgi:GH25 family lysozyme M1 (1,4-beta-N-acetylmuramidase)